jgi:hypothetical protein
LKLKIDQKDVILQHPSSLLPKRFFIMMPAIIGADFLGLTIHATNILVVR